MVAGKWHHVLPQFIYKPFTELFGIIIIIISCVGAMCTKLTEKHLSATVLIYILYTTYCMCTYTSLITSEVVRVIECLLGNIQRQII